MDVSKAVYSHIAMAIKLMGSEYLAYDLLHDAALKILSANPKISDEQELQKYAWTAIKNCFVSYGRKKKMVIVDWIPEIPVYIAPAIEVKEVRQVMEQKLHKRNKEPLILFSEGFQIPELMEIYKTTKTAMLARMFQGRKQLREIFNYER